jgi:hypothetical protein
MPNWPVTPLSKINVGNAKNPIPAAAPDVQLQLRDFEMLVQRHQHATTPYNYNTLSNNNKDGDFGDPETRYYQSVRANQAIQRVNRLQKNAAAWTEHGRTLTPKN